MTRLHFVRNGAVMLLCLVPVVLAGRQLLLDTTAVKGLVLTDEEQRLVDLTNQERAKEELRPLKPHPFLMRAARQHAENMARQQILEHDLDGKTPSDRVKLAGYRFRRLGENVARGPRTAEAAVRGWMSSEGHRENILRPEFTEIGVGVARDATGKPYYVQVFACPLHR